MVPSCFLGSCSHGLFCSQYTGHRIIIRYGVHNHLEKIGKHAIDIIPSHGKNGETFTFFAAEDTHTMCVCVYLFDRIARGGNKTTFWFFPDASFQKTAPEPNSVRNCVTAAADYLFKTQEMKFNSHQNARKAKNYFRRRRFRFNCLPSHFFSVFLSFFFKWKEWKFLSRKVRKKEPGSKAKKALTMPGNGLRTKNKGKNNRRPKRSFSTVDIA